MEQTKLVCLCGSSRFTGIMAVCAWLIERDEGKITMGLHLLPGWYCNYPDHLAEHEGVAEKMDELHLRKIDVCDEVFVVNVGNYIGKSTEREIEYARVHDKKIRLFTDDPIGKKIMTIDVVAVTGLFRENKRMRNHEKNKINIIDKLELATPDKYYINFEGKFIEVIGEKVDFPPYTSDFFIHHSWDKGTRRLWRVSEGITGGSLCPPVPKRIVKKATMIKLEACARTPKRLAEKIRMLLGGDFDKVSPRYKKKEA